MEPYMQIGELIHHYRKEKGMSQEELADGICSKKYISELEHHKKTPTLFIVNELSSRLGVNLYDNYAIMLRHKNIATHKKCILLNEAINSGDYENMKQLCNQYQDDPGFQDGEPLLLLKYAECIYLSNVLRDSSAAVKLAKNALNIIDDRTLTSQLQNRQLTNVELVLLNFIGVNSCRLKQYHTGHIYLSFLYQYLDTLFKENPYVSNPNDHFELRFFATLVYNDFCFFYPEKTFESERLDTVLSILKTLHSHYLLPELLLCKTKILVDSNNLDEAIGLYHIAHSLGLYLYTKDYITALEKKRLPQDFPF